MTSGTTATTVEDRAVCAESWTIDRVRCEVHRWAVVLNLLPKPNGVTNDTPADHTQVAGSSGKPVDPDAEAQQQELLANADEWFTSLDLLLRPFLNRYKYTTYSQFHRSSRPLMNGLRTRRMWTPWRTTFEHHGTERRKPRHISMQLTKSSRCLRPTLKSKKRRSPV